MNSLAFLSWGPLGGVALAAGGFPCEGGVVLGFAGLAVGGDGFGSDCVGCVVGSGCVWGGGASLSVEGKGSSTGGNKNK